MDPKNPLLISDPRSFKVKGPGGIELEVDVEDPHTPVMVHFGTNSSTYWYVQAMGDVEGEELTKAQNDWIESFEAVCLAAEAKARNGHPEYS